MLFRDPKNWTNIDEMRGLLFFVQRVEELTFPYTLDSYKSPTMSVQGLSEEIVDLLNDKHFLEVVGEDKVLNSVDYVVDELRDRIRGNFIVRAISSTKLDRGILARHERERIDETLRKFTIIFAEMDEEHYTSEIISNVISLSSRGDKKIKLDFLAKEFVSVLQHSGVDRQHINSTLVEYFWGKGEVSSPDQLRVFCQKVFPHLHKFMVLVGVSGSFSELDPKFLSYFGISVFNNIDKSGEKHELLEGFEEESGCEWVCVVEVSATDYNSASSKAYSLIERAFSFYRVFNHKDVLVTSDVSWAKQGCCEEFLKKLESKSNSMHFVPDMRKKKAAMELEKYSKLTSLGKGSDRNRFWNLLNMHAMSMDVSSSDIQLINIWTCMETVSLNKKSSTIVSSVVSSVVPVLMLGYLNRILMNLLSDVLRWNKSSLKAVLKNCQVRSGRDLKWDFYHLLAEGDNEEARKEMYSICGDFELLRYRINCVSRAVSVHSGS